MFIHRTLQNDAINISIEIRSNFMKISNHSGSQYKMSTTTKTRWDDILPLQVPKAFIMFSDPVPSLFTDKWLSNCTLSHHREANFMYSLYSSIVHQWKCQDRAVNFFYYYFFLTFPCIFFFSSHTRRPTEQYLTFNKTELESHCLIFKVNIQPCLH